MGSACSQPRVILGPDEKKSKGNLDALAQLDDTAPVARAVRIGYKDSQGTKVLSVMAGLGNARKLNSPPTLTGNGFQLVQFKHGITDFLSDTIDEQMKEKFYPAFEQVLLQEMAGASKVKVFNHGLRASNVTGVPQPPSDKPAMKAPVKEAHSDFSPSYSPIVARALGFAEEVDVKKQRYCLVNLWMSIDQQNPVMQTPLAFCNSRSVSQEDTIDNFVNCGGKDTEEWDGQMNPRFRSVMTHGGDEKEQEISNSKHEWLYFPKMIADEAVIFKQFDSSTSESESKSCIHAAIDLEEQGESPLPPRQSCEVRAIASF